MKTDEWHQEDQLYGVSMRRSILDSYLDELIAKGLSAEDESKFRAEFVTVGTPHLSVGEAMGFGFEPSGRDGAPLFHSPPLNFNSACLSKSLDELLERDQQREKDGFPRKIQVGRLLKPVRGGRGRVVIVPTTVEEKFYHDPTIRSSDDGGGTGGTGEGEEGEVIGEQPVRRAGDGSATGSGEGGGESHELESSAYELGRTLTEKFHLPNLREKGKKRSLTRFRYDLNDRNRGFGQLLDKKSTLRKIVETNMALGNIPDVSAIDPSGFIIAPRDKVYRILSREKDFDSQALLFFVRDYSGSMAGKATELIVSQHVLIYSWLLYQYSGQVECRFILHDTDAKEVPDFYTYYNSNVAGGTQVYTAYQLINEIVARESLTSDYNIYVFQGTDGDDWDVNGEKALPELAKIMVYASRVGITVTERSETGGTAVARYLKGSGLLASKPELIRMDVMADDADEARLIEGIKKLIS